MCWTAYMKQFGNKYIFFFVRVALCNVWFVVLLGHYFSTQCVMISKGGMNV